VAQARPTQGRSLSRLGPPPLTLRTAASHTCGTVRRRGAGNPLDCSLLARRARLVPRRLKVDVLREAPPVYVVHDFLSIEECGFMMNKTVPHSEAAALGTRVPIPTRPPLEPGPVLTRVLYQRQAPTNWPLHGFPWPLHGPLRR